MKIKITKTVKPKVWIRRGPKIQIIELDELASCKASVKFTQALQWALDYIGVSYGNVIFIAAQSFGELKKDGSIHIETSRGTGMFKVTRHLTMEVIK